MRKLLIVVLTLAALVTSIYSQPPTKENSFESFMGTRWKMRLTVFRFMFRHRDKLEITENIAELRGFKIGEIQTNNIVFHFRKEHPREFYMVVIFLKPGQFHELIRVLTTKYGPITWKKELAMPLPSGKTYNDMIHYWYDKKSGRAILAGKYLHNRTMGSVVFAPDAYFQNIYNEKKNTIQKAADEL